MNNFDPYDKTQDGPENLIPPSEAGIAEHPQRIGRYRIEKVLGKGGFGIVYLAHDEQLSRRVAVKVPHAKLISKPEDAEAYLAEARTVANLDHPGIVPVHDVGSMENCPCYIVSKYIPGTDLATTIKQHRHKYREAAEIVATVAEALHYAHKQGLVHRDVKPGNILIGKDDKPYVVDFGLALREENIGKGPKYAGTPAYMSPEQARGEGHRVDGRSDVFSLGIVFYELLAGRQPFRGDTQAELLEQVTSYEARPLRQYDEKLPKELERICHKAMAKRANDRYSSAHDLAEDLRHFLAEQTLIQSGASPGGIAAVASETHASHIASTSVGSIAASSASLGAGSSDSQLIKIVPKGLRSFDAHDTDFFLELLPGPRDREGLPDSLRFWKTRIEETDPDNTFKVGLIYGPSGCGKSSLVKAGLLPRLSEEVIAVYIEATPEETETRLLHGLRKRCPALEDNLTLKETLAALRRGQGIPVGKKVLIVLDQFEQWLHAKKEEENTHLVQALRQCDGGKVQCIVMVRDDFWMAATRFMRELEVRLVEAQNSAAVDLFPVRHAEKVLVAFGRAFGTLPDNVKELNKEQKSFLTQSVAGLAEDGKVICVRLALFAEMMKGKAWTLATLRDVGGTKGVGVTFLEETFSASTSPPEHRYHQKAARAVLKDLLPDSGMDLKGYMRSYAELLEASGYGNRPKDFDELIRILDSEIRLITPTDPEGKFADNESVTQTQAGQKYFQLTHDYLVHSLRDWLTRKQKETRKGRAELKLFDTAVTWNAKPENRFLPSWWENLNIRLFTDRKKWTEPQREMMGKAGRVHGIRTSLVALLLVGVTFAGISVRLAILDQQSRTQAQVQEKENVTRAEGLVASLLSADSAGVPAIVSDLKAYRAWADPLLREESDKAADKSRQKLHASLALLPVDTTQVDYVYGRLIDAEPHEVPVIRDALAPHKDALLDKLWAVVEKPEKGKESQRLRAASALGKYDPESEKWTKAQETVGNDLVAVPAVYLAMWMDSLRPVRTKLFTQLSAVYRDATRREVERSLATDILADYAADQPSVLADLLMDADDKQFAVIYPKFKEQGERGLPVLTAEIDMTLPPDLTSSDDKREKLAKRQANAAVGLLRMNQQAKVWPLLKHSPDPRVRSYLIHRLSPLGADAQAIVKRLNEEPDITIRRALLLSLGEFKETEFTPDDRNALLPKLQEMYRTADDPGLHASVEWLLRQWKQEAWLTQVNDEWAKDKEGREKKIAEIKELVTKDKKSPPQWYVNTQGQTLVVIPGPVEFVMGSPVTEIGRYENELQHKRRISRTFALATKSVTLEQYGQFDKGHSGFAEKSGRSSDWPSRRLGPVTGIDWYQAAKYCNWLSEQEGLPVEQWCFEITRDEIKLKAGYLSLSGYRFPTEAEMEYATRAGALTSRYFGETDELLPKYAWYNKNSPDKTSPVARLKPNDFGLFDVQGNCYTWCQESFKAYPQGTEAAEDTEDGLEILSTSDRVLRGASFINQSSPVRSFFRFSFPPRTRNPVIGFRVARTLPLVSHTPLPRPDENPGI